MTRKFRRFIFLAFTVFFVVTSIIIILFAQGYRFDFNSLKIVKTGGIFIKTSADGAKIYINDKYVESTSGILSYSTLISGLAPKNYNVFVYKENYYPWNKIVEIKNGMVTELSNIILFPLELKKNKIVELPTQVISEFAINDNAIKIKNNKTKTAKTYNLTDGKLLSSEKFKAATSSEEFISPDKNKKLYLSNNQLWIDYLKDIKREPIKSAGEKELITSYETPIIFFDWLSDSEHLIWFANGALTIAELDNRGGKRNSVKFYLNIDSPVFWDRDNYDFYFFEKIAEKNILYKINFKT
ncbi:MAG: PEGA domain-containing protein [Candidatus Azambacteria bacterium]|nr:PEGA domain-containing protein [Candidatus Azambacteria bacterium]